MSSCWKYSEFSVSILAGSVHHKNSGVCLFGLQAIFHIFGVDLLRTQPTVLALIRESIGDLLRSLHLSCLQLLCPVTTASSIICCSCRCEQCMLQASWNANILVSRQWVLVAVTVLAQVLLSASLCLVDTPQTQLSVQQAALCSGQDQRWTQVQEEKEETQKSETEEVQNIGDVEDLLRKFPLLFISAPQSPLHVYMCCHRLKKKAPITPVTASKLSPGAHISVSVSPSAPSSLLQLSSSTQFSTFPSSCSSSASARSLSSKPESQSSNLASFSGSSSCIKSTMSAPSHSISTHFTASSGCMHSLPSKSVGSSELFPPAPTYCDLEHTCDCAPNILRNCWQYWNSWVEQLASFSLEYKSLENDDLNSAISSGGNNGFGEKVHSGAHLNGCLQCRWSRIIQDGHFACCILDRAIDHLATQRQSSIILQQHRRFLEWPQLKQDICSKIWALLAILRLDEQAGPVLDSALGLLVSTRVGDVPCPHLSSNSFRRQFGCSSPCQSEGDRRTTGPCPCSPYRTRHTVLDADFLSHIQLGNELETLLRSCQKTQIQALLSLCHESPEQKELDLSFVHAKKRSEGWLCSEHLQRQLTWLLVELHGEDEHQASLLSNPMDQPDHVLPVCPAPGFMFARLVFCIAVLTFDYTRPSNMAKTRAVPTDHQPAPDPTCSEKTDSSASARRLWELWLSALTGRSEKLPTVGQLRAQLAKVIACRRVGRACQYISLRRGPAPLCVLPVFSLGGNFTSPALSNISSAAISDMTVATDESNTTASAFADRFSLSSSDPALGGRSSGTHNQEFTLMLLLQLHLGRYEELCFGRLFAPHSGNDLSYSRSSITRSTSSSSKSSTSSHLNSNATKCNATRAASVPSGTPVAETREATGPTVESLEDELSATVRKLREACLFSRLLWTVLDLYYDLPFQRPLVRKYYTEWLRQLLLDVPLAVLLANWQPLHWIFLDKGFLSLLRGVDEEHGTAWPLGDCLRFRARLPLLQIPATCEITHPFVALSHILRERLDQVQKI